MKADFSHTPLKHNLGSWTKDDKEPFGGKPRPWFEPQPNIAQPELATPTFIVVDEFKTKNVDVDGDGIRDLSNGQVVERIIRSRLPGAHVRRVEIPVTALRTSSELLKNITDRFNEIKEQLEKGAQFKGVSLSLALPVQLAFLTNIITDPNGVPFTSENLAQRRQELKGKLSDVFNVMFPGWKEALSAIESVAQRCPVYLGAGNLGPESLNMLSLADGVKTVGATDANGNIPFFSPSHGLVKKFARGILPVRKLEGGFDLTGSGTVEVQDQEVSGGQPLVKRFVGKPLADVLLSDQEFQQLTRDKNLDILQSKLLSFSQLAKLGVISEKYANEPQYIYHHNGSNYLVFKADAAGRVIFDPDNAEIPGAVNALSWTAFATPWALTGDNGAKDEISYI